MVFLIPLPSVAFAVIFTVFPFPAFFAVTFPFAVTVAYLLFELFHASCLFTSFPVVFTVALTVIAFPFFNVSEAFNVIFFTACFSYTNRITSGLFTSVNRCCLYGNLLLLSLFTVTFPAEVTVAYFLLEVVHFTFLSVAFAGDTFAFN